MGGFFVDGFAAARRAAGGFACHQPNIRKAAQYPLYGLQWHIGPLRAPRRPDIEGRYAPRARQLGVQPLREFRLALPPCPAPNRRTRKCSGGHQRGAVRAPGADYQGPRPVTIVMLRTMDTRVRLFGENGKTCLNAKDSTKPR